MIPSANQDKELTNLQCHESSSKISVNPRAPPAQLCTQNMLVGLKGMEQSTQQEAEDPFLAVPTPVGHDQPSAAAAQLQSL